MPESSEELNPSVAQFIQDFYTQVDALSDADAPDTTPSSGAPKIPSSSAHISPIPSPLSSAPLHNTSLTLPADLWHRLKTECPDRGIRTFIVTAIREKFAQPHISDLVTAARGLARITEELLLTAESQPANASRVLAELHEVLNRFQ